MADSNIKKHSVAVKNLLFDPDNPRLPQEIEKTQEAILDYLVLDIGIDDVLSSIAASGYVAGDPVIVKSAEATGKYYVVEGNRRLAALKLLNNGPIAKGPKIPAMSSAVKKTIVKIEVQSNWPTDELISYLGYKHVTAAKEWGPEAKARFVINNTKDFTDDSLRRFARELGTKLGVLKRWLTAYKALEQAKRSDILSEDVLSNRRVFGTFYTLLGSEQVKEFIGFNSEAIVEEPVSNTKEFGEFLGWVMGTEDKGPSINSRDQKDLSRVLANEFAKDYFREHQDLKAALRYATATKDEVASVLRQASYLIDNVVSEVREQKNDEKVRAAFINLKRSFENVQILFGDRVA